MSKNGTKKGFRIWKLPLYLIGAVLILAVLLVLFLTVTEYRPKDRETMTVTAGAEKKPAAGDTLTLMTWNIGYGALGDNADFFMDGGKGVKTADTARLESNLAGILKEIDLVQPDILLLQETDRSSTRSEHIDEYLRVGAHLEGFSSSFANNFKVAFLPYPIPPIGTVDSGIATYSSFTVSDAERVQLPIPFSWPVRMANLKRCVLISRVPLEGSDKELVLVNLHLEAYDSGEGKIAQTKMLAELLEAEAAKGNYVIAGGDFNQIFSCYDKAKYPQQEGKWAAGELDVSQFAAGWQFVMDDTVPTCRSLDQPYAGAEKEGFQFYMLDGFIVSANVRVESVITQDLEFVCSDHNPVVMTVTLQ
nr:endonuclease [Lachnospiraceae bacterium]